MASVPSGTARRYQVRASRRSTSSGFLEAPRSLRAAATVVGGSSRGRDDLARAGGADVARLDEAFERMRQLVRRERGQTPYGLRGLTPFRTLALSCLRPDGPVLPGFAGPPLTTVTAASPPCGGRRSCSLGSSTGPPQR